MLQLTRARNRLTTPATLTLPEIAASGLTVSASGQETGSSGRDTGVPRGPGSPKLSPVRVLCLWLCIVFWDRVLGFHPVSPKYITPDLSQ